MNAYHRYVSELERLFREGRRFPLGGFPELERQPVREDAGRALIFSPHPDDECIIGGLALRLQREAGMRIVNVAVTQGSNRARQSARWQELTAACNYLGFDLVATGPGGLEKVNVKTRSDDPAHWRASVDVIAAVLSDQRPEVVFFPHADDWNSTHIGTHHLIVDALTQQPSTFTCLTIETEFWGAMATPNLMVESSAHDLGDMLSALSFHVGEVQRNPYHLLVPAWMQDNVRRGSELVGGQGGAAPDFAFATLYRLRRWKDGQLQKVYDGGRTIDASTSASYILSHEWRGSPGSPSSPSSPRFSRFSRFSGFFGFCAVRWVPGSKRRNLRTLRTQNPAPGEPGEPGEPRDVIGWPLAEAP